MVQKGKLFPDDYPRIMKNIHPWLVTNLRLIGDHPGDAGLPSLSLGWWVTIQGMVTDHPWQLSPGLDFVS